MRKHFIVSVVIVMVFAMVLAACSNNNGGSSDAVEIEFWTFQDLHGRYMLHMADMWNDKYPDKPIELISTTLPFDELHNNLLIALQSSVGAPDMSDIEIGRFGNYMKGTPQLYPLNDVVESELDNIVRSRVDIYAKDGNFYGFDYHIGASVIYYNTEILDAAGVNADDIKTWDDFAAAGQTVLEKTGVPMTTLETTEHWSFWPLIAQQGSDFLDENGEVILDNETNVKVLTYLQDLIKSGVAVGAPDGFHHTESYWGFMNDGGAASIWMPMWYMGRFVDNMPDLQGKIAIKPMPAWSAGGARSAGMGGTATVVTNQSSNPELAAEFLAFAKLSREGNIELWTQLGFDPPRMEVWESDELKEPNQFTEYFGDNIFDVLVEVSDEIMPVNTGEKLPEMITEVQSKVMFRTLSELEDPETVLKEVANQLR